MNSFIEYYGERKISPVVQDISDIEKHYKKREKLYRQLGMPPILFRNANILEVGPGSGYNTLAFFQWGANVHLVEPNPTGIKDMRHLFKDKNIANSKYMIYEGVIEDFHNKNEYDIIIAEGFLHSIDNAKSIIDKLKKKIIRGGVIVVTCMDEMSMFVEQMKRFVCHYLIADVEDYNEQVMYCTNLFEAQFSDLNGMSRTVEDWVKDDMLNPAFNNVIILNMAEAIKLFGDDFYVLGSSQKIFTDYSWYKDLSYLENENCIKQFEEKQHTFLMTGIKESKMNQYDHSFLKKQLSEIRSKCILFETDGRDVIDDILSLLETVIHIAANIDMKFFKFVRECIEILSGLKNDKNINLEKFQVFFKAVGRTQQYLSMVKQYKY